MSQSPGPGWWLASDGKWYPPHLHPDVRRSTAAPAERRPATPQMSEPGTAPAPLGDPNAPLPRRQPGGAPGAAPAASAAAPAPATPRPQTPATTPPLPTTDTPAPAPTAAPQTPAATPPLPTTDTPAPAPTAATQTPAAPADGPPAVRWNSDQQRQPVESTPSDRGLSAPPDDDSSRLIPLPDLDAEPPTEAPRITNRAPTLADTLLGGRATTPEAAPPTPTTDRRAPAPSPGGPPDGEPRAERWERPDPLAAPADAAAVPVAEARVAAPQIEPTETSPEPEPEPADRADDDSKGRRRSDRLVNVAVVGLAVVLAAGAAYFLLRDDGGSEPTEDDDLRAVTALVVGDCFGGELLGEAEVEQVSVVDCTMPHRYQVFHATQFEPPDSAFDAEAIRSQATEVCRAELDDLLGVPAAEAGLDLLLLNPTEESWQDEQDRTSLCLAYDPSGPLRAPIGS